MIPLISFDNLFGNINSNDIISACLKGPSEASGTDSEVKNLVSIVKVSFHSVKQLREIRLWDSSGLVVDVGDSVEEVRLSHFCSAVNGLPFIEGDAFRHEVSICVKL